MDSNPTTPSQAFAFLRESLPSWLESLSTVTLQSQNRVSSSAGEANTASSGTTDWSRHTEIVHLENGELQKVVTSPPELSGDVQMVRSPLAKHFKSRPKPASVSSVNETVTCYGYRAQNAIVVDYDSAAQKRLEGIVEDVSRTRNLLRKAKASSRRPAFAYKIPQEDDDDDDDNGNDDEDDDDELDDDTVLAQVRMRRGRMMGGSQGQVEDEKTAEALDAADKRLVQVQDLCEMAAFQLLRDGDCSEETGRAIGELKKVLAGAKVAVAGFKAEEVVATLQGEKAKTPLVNSYPRRSEDSESSEEKNEAPLLVRMTDSLNKSGARGQMRLKKL